MLLEAVVNQPTIEAENVLLRPLRKSDAAVIGHYANDKRVAEMTTNIPSPLPPGLAEAFVERAMADNRDEDVWVIDGSPGKREDFIGLISLQTMDRDQSEVGYWIAPPFWNLGYASQALGAVLGANPHGNKTVFAQVFQDNPVSARVLTNAGFIYLGDAEAYSVAREANVPTWTYLRRMDDAPTS